MNKITLATYKSFVKKNAGTLQYKSLSHFDGMVDCVMPVEMDWIDVENYEDLLNNKIGWLVGHSRDYFDAIENGIRVYNACGSFMVRTK